MRKLDLIWCFLSVDTLLLYSLIFLRRVDFMGKLLGYFHAVGLVGSKLSISCVFDGVDHLKSGSLIPIPHSMFLVPMFLIPKFHEGRSIFLHLD